MKNCSDLDRYIDLGLTLSILYICIYLHLHLQIPTNFIAFICPVKYYWWKRLLFILNLFLMFDTYHRYSTLKLKMENVKDNI